MGAMSPVLHWEPLKGQNRRGKITITKSVLNINRELQSVTLLIRCPLQTLYLQFTKTHKNRGEKEPEMTFRLWSELTEECSVCKFKPLCREGMNTNSHPVYIESLF